MQTTSVKEFINSGGESVRIEEIKNDIGEVVSYQQWNNGVLIIHRIWVCPQKHISTYFEDKTDKYWRKSSYHTFKEWNIKNTWDSDGRWNRFYSTLNIDTNTLDVNFCSRYVGDMVDTGYVEKKIKYNGFKSKE